MVPPVAGCDAGAVGLISGEIQLWQSASGNLISLSPICIVGKYLRSLDSVDQQAARHQRLARLDLTVQPSLHGTPNWVNPDSEDTP